MPFVILASGTGTNARALLERARERSDAIEVKALISDREGAGALKVAEEFGVRAAVIPVKEEARLLDFLAETGAHWACLAGYKRLVSEAFLEFFSAGGSGFARVLNVHPSLLPAYPGLGGYERAFRDGVKVSGVTVHLVDNGLDTGLPVLQESFQREEGDTLESFEKKGRALERKLFPRAMELAAAERIRVIEKNGARFVSLEAE
jgi:phosphoribosylglycinamide formyltransferase-1